MSLKQENNISKKIKVLILGEPDEGLGVKFIRKIWNIVKKQLEKEGYEINETVVKDPNYDKEIMNFTKNGYDMVVGYISILHKRTKHGNYTNPIILDQLKIGFEPDSVTTFRYKILRQGIVFFFLFIVLTIILTLLLFNTGNHFSSKNKRFKWNLWGVISALLGEPGALVEKIDIKNIPSILITFLILLFMFVISLLFEAALTQSYIERDIEAKKDPIGTDIKGKRFHVVKGTSHVWALNQEGAIPVAVDVGISDIQDYYLKHKSKDKVKGFITDMAGWGKLKTETKKTGKYNTLIDSQYQFPYDEAGWLIEKNNYILLDDIQEILRKLHEDKTIKKICVKELPYMEKTHCGI